MKFYQKLKYKIGLINLILFRPNLIYKIQPTEKNGSIRSGEQDNPNIIINPKENFEKFKNRSINKKHKGARKDTKSMCFKAYTEKIKNLLH